MPKETFESSAFVTCRTWHMLEQTQAGISISHDGQEESVTTVAVSDSANGLE